MRSLLLTLFLVTGMVQAQDTGDTPGPVEYIQIDDIGRLPYQRLFEAFSQPNESLDAFAARISPRLVAYSQETGYEACGVFASDGSRNGIIVGTNHANLACANFTAKRPDGMESRRITIHSHGNGAAKMTRSDLRFMGLSEDARSQRMFGTVYGQDREHFSERDLNGSAGYLATPTKVLYQDGQGKIREVATTP